MHRPPLLAVVALLSAGCEPEPIVRPDPYPACLWTAVEPIAPDALHAGATAEEGIARLDGRVGTWRMKRPRDKHPGTPVELRSSAAPAGEPHLYDLQMNTTGEPCQVAGGPLLGVPVALELASADGVWSFSGEVVFFHGTDTGWRFLDTWQPNELQVHAVDEAQVGEALSETCGTERVLGVDGFQRADQPDLLTLDLLLGTRCWYEADQIEALDVARFGEWTAEPLEPEDPEDPGDD